MKAIVIGISREQFEAAKARLLSEDNVTISGDQGTVSHDGVTVEYEFGSASLLLTVKEKPFLLPETVIENSIRNWFSTPTKSGVSTSAASLVALLLCCSLALTGCTPQQQADTKAVIAKVISYEPEVTLAADSLASTVALFEPQDAVLITAGDAVFHTALGVLDVSARAYLATPNDGTLASVRTALESVLSINADQFLAAAQIKNPVSLAAAKAAIVAVREVLLLMDGAFQATQTPAVNAAAAQARTLKVSAIKPWLDRDPAYQQRVELATGHSYQAVYSYETSLGY